MAQFDIHAYRGPAKDVSFVLDLQNDLVGALATRVVAPVYAIESLPAEIRGLTPDIDVEGCPCRVAIMELAAVRTSELGAVVGTAASHREALIGALDLLFTGV